MLEAAAAEEVDTARRAAEAAVAAEAAEAAEAEAERMRALQASVTSTREAMLTKSMTTASGTRAVVPGSILFDAAKVRVRVRVRVSEVARWRVARRRLARRFATERVVRRARRARRPSSILSGTVGSRD